MLARKPKLTSLFARSSTSAGEAVGNGAATNFGNETTVAAINDTKQIKAHLKQYLLAVQGTGCSNATLRNYKSDINQFCDFVPDLQLSDFGNKPKLLAFAHSQRDKGLKEASIKRKLVSLTQFKLWLKQQGLLRSEVPLLSENTAPADESTLEIINKQAVGNTKPSQSPDRQNRKPLQPPASRLTLLLNLLALLLLMAGLGYFGYQQFGQAVISMAYPSTPTAPNRILSYQGRLTNTAQTPISVPTNMLYKLFDADTGGTELWSSNICNVDPDQDGIFVANLGAGAGAGADDDDCGGAIPDSVFTENSNVWLEVTVATETLTPRQPIRTVAYAINSETVQGLRPSEVATNSTILIMNSSGEVVLGTTSPVIKTDPSSDGLTIESKKITIQTSAGSDGDIILDPDGTGIVDIQGDLNVSGTSTLVGNTYITSPNTLIFGGTTALGESTSPTDSGAYLIGVNDEFTNSNSNNVQAVLKDLDTAIVGAGTITWSSLTAPVANLSLNHGTYTTAFDWATNTGTNNLFSLTTTASSNGTGSLLNVKTGTSSTVSPLRVRAGSAEALFVSNAGRVGVGTINPMAKLDIRQVVDGDITHGLIVSSTDGYGGGMYRQGGASGQLILRNNSINTIAMSSGNVGIGDTNPKAKLHVAGAPIFGTTRFGTYGTVGASRWTKFATIPVTDRYSNPQAEFLIQSRKGSVILYAEVASGATYNTVADEKFYISNNWNNGIPATNFKIGRVDTGTQVNYDIWVATGSWSDLTFQTRKYSNHNGSGPDIVYYTDTYSTNDGADDPVATGYDAALAVNESWNNVGNVTFGDNSADTVTSKASRWTFANDTNFDLNGGVNGLSFDNNTLSIDATNNRVGIGTTSPVTNSKLDVAGRIVGGLGHAGETALATSASEHWISAKSLITLGETSAGNANPAITMYRTESGFSSGRAYRIYAPNSLGDLRFQIGTNGNVAYGSETYEDIMTMKAGGNVGIGTTSPSGRLHIFSDSATPISQPALVIDQNKATQDIITAASSGTPRMSLKNDGTLELYNASSSISNTAGDISINAASGNISLSSNNLINVNNAYFAGNVSINTVIPDELLTVNGNVNAEKYFDITNKNYFLDPAAAGVALKIAGEAEILGSVGIGVNAPVSVKLQVNGNALFSSSTNPTSAAMIRSSTGYTTATTPNYTFWNNDQVGMFHPSANNLAFSTAGLERLRIDAAGNLGLGLTTPGQRLTIATNLTGVLPGGYLSTANMLLGQNESGAYFGRTGLRENHWLTTPETAGVTWIERGVLKNWLDVAMSSDGKIQIATAANYMATPGSIYISSDYGVTWTVIDDTRNWQRAAMSADGKIQAAVVYDGQIYTSTDYGVTWTARESSRNWHDIAISADGKIQTATVAGGQIYTSTDYGVTWTARDSSRNWQGVAMSSDGKIQTAVVYDGQIYTSTDYGVTWTARDSSRNWFGVAMSADGKIQTAVASSAQIYTSTDYGVTWTARDSSRNWQGVAMSSDGKIQTATSNGQIYTSINHGVTWTARDSSRNWQGVAMSSDGKIQTTLVSTNAYIYTSHAATSMLAGNVGIGTTSPNGKLDIQTATDKNLLIRENINLADGVSLYAVNTANSSVRGMEFGASGYYFAGGSVGIGITAPYGKLDVNSGRSNTVNAANSDFNVGGEDVRLSMGAYAGTPHWGTWIQSSQITTDSVLSLSINPNGGYVALGMATAPVYLLDLPNNANASGRARANQWLTYSDITLKENIQPLNNALTKVLALSGVSFNWRGSGVVDSGFIAQWVEPIIPEIVSTAADGIKSIEYSRLTPYLVEAIKTEHGRTNTISSQLSALSRDLALSSTGEIVLSGSSPSTYAVATPAGSANRIAALADLVVARIRAGYIQTRELIAERLTITGRLTAPDIHTKKLSSGDGEIEVASNLAVSEDLSVGGDLLVTDSLEVTGPTKLAKLITDSIEADTANFHNASISGTLTVDRIHATSIESSLISGLQERLSEQINATLSEPTLLAQLFGSSTQHTEEYLAHIRNEMNAYLDQNNEASASATPSSEPTLPTPNFGDDLTLMADTAFINTYLQVNQSTYIQNTLKVGQALLLGDTTSLAANYFSFTDQFSIQPSGQGRLSLMADMLVLDESGVATINANFRVAGSVDVEADLAVHGTLLGNMLSAADTDQNIRVQLAQTDLDPLTGEEIIKEQALEFVNETQTPVATISATGDLALTGTLRLANQGSDPNATASATPTSNPSAGQAVLLAGQTEIVIANPLVEEGSMIYITPLNSTNNQVLFVKNKLSDSSFTPENEGQFTVAIDFALGHNVTFNWWIVQTNAN